MNEADISFGEYCLNKEQLVISEYFEGKKRYKTVIFIRIRTEVFPVRTSVRGSTSVQWFLQFFSVHLGTS